MATRHAVALGVVVAILLGVGVSMAQRRGARSLSPATAREIFATVVEAASDLVVLEVEPGDANGAVRAWDRRWSDRLQGLRRRIGSLTAPCVRPDWITDCRRREACVLLSGNPAASVETARTGLYRDLEEDSARPHLAVYLAARRIVADMAATRAAADLACEDLPDSFDLDTLGLPDAYEADAETMLRVARDGREERAAEEAVAEAERWACDGELPSHELREVVGGAAAGIRGCFETALRADPSLRGDLRLRLRVAADGSVVDVQTTGALGDGVVGACAAAIAASLRFTEPRGGDCSVLEVPYHFESRL